MQVSTQEKQRAAAAPGRVFGARANGSPAALVPKPEHIPKTQGTEADAADDRRLSARRKPLADRAREALKPAVNVRLWFPRKWPYLVLYMAISLAGLMAFAAAQPPLTILLKLGAALLGVLAITPLHDFAAKRGKGCKLAAGFVAVIAPLFLFSFGLTQWTMAGGIAFDVTIATLLCTSGIAVAYLRRFPAAFFGSLCAIWMAVVVAEQSLAGFMALCLGGLLAILISRDQAAEQWAEEEQHRALERVQTRARDILADYEETGQGWFWETDRRSLLTYVSVPVARAVSRDPDDLIGQPLVQLFDLTNKGEESERTLMFHLSARSSFQELAVRAAIETEERWWSVSGRPIYDEFDNFVGFRGSGTDLTEQRRSQENASRLARYDSLTGLANRYEMSQALEKILNSRQESNRCCAVMLLDLDRFKQVNDTLGHPVGDVLLKQVAQRLERAVGKKGQVGRLGGDEFQVILPGRIERQSLVDLGQLIIHSLSQPYSIDGQRVVIGASVGVAISPDDGASSDELIRNADLALYAAKDGGRGRYHFYSQDLHADAEARSQMEEDLRDAIAKGELELFYQPVIATATEKIAGFEALLRWQHPVKGWISPDKFVSIAEECGLISQIGEWALRTACHHLAKWPSDVRVAVNVSTLQFANPQLPSVVTNALAQSQVDPSRLELEITESVFLNNDAGSDAMFAALKNIGVRLALDDFGTGYSSLGYLRTAPFDKIKIDQSFVRGATQEGSRNGAIIASITSLAHALGMDVTAEGVETLDELDLVRQHGCSHVQGFIYERPLSHADATRRLEAGLSAVARGPRSSRASRQTMLRKVMLDHHGQNYTGTVRNISATGALIEGLWEVPVGTIFTLHFSKEHKVLCTTRWGSEDKMGVEFAQKLARDAQGRILAVQDGGTPVARRQLRTGAA